MTLLRHAYLRHPHGARKMCPARDGGRFASFLPRRADLMDVVFCPSRCGPHGTVVEVRGATQQTWGCFRDTLRQKTVGIILSIKVW
jgi:hypothetical protein